MKHHIIPNTKCPFCGLKIDRSTGGETKPQPGDVSVCIECAEPSVYTATLTIRKPTPKENDQLVRDVNVITAQMLIRSSKP